MENNRDFKYALQDFSNVYIGARLTYEELIEQDDVPQRLKSAIYQYIYKEETKECQISEHLLRLKEESMSYMVYSQLKVQVKILFPETVTDKKGRARVEFKTNTYDFKNFVHDEQLKGQIKVGQITEITFKKLHLMALGV